MCERLKHDKSAGNHSTVFFIFFFRNKDIGSRIDERKRAAAEKRRLLEITEAFEQRRKDRLEQRTRSKAEKAARFGREVVHSGTSV